MWALPGGERMPGETFTATLARTVWEEAGGLLDKSRLIGGLRSASHDVDVAPPEYLVYMTADLRELLPFSDEFAAQDRILIDVGLAPSLIAGWNQLMDELLAYVQAARNAAVARETA
jgi:8-oxo-dGTP pyrophosphatase MutT (NUDIX family)